MSNEVTVETLERLVDAFSAHDLDAVMSFFSDDCVLEMPRGPDPWGRRLEGREQVREGLGAASPAFRTSTTATPVISSQTIARAPSGS